MKYSDKLKDPRWQRKRLEILKRDGFKCMCCLSKENMLSIHHKYYRTDLEPWEYSKKALITTCQKCHDVVKFINFENLWKRRLKLRVIRSFHLIPDFIIILIFKAFKLKNI